MNEPDVIIITKDFLTAHQLKTVTEIMGFQTWEHILIPEDTPLEVRRGTDNKFEFIDPELTHSQEINFTV